MPTLGPVPIKQLWMRTRERITSSRLVSPLLECRVLVQRKPARGRTEFIHFQMPTLMEKAQEGAEWIHEVKYDGYRTQIHIDPTGVRAYTRNGHDWTDKYPSIVDRAPSLGCKSAILDGEVIVTTAEGKSDFGALRKAITSNPDWLAFIAFDLLWLNGEDIRPLPCIERRARLWSLVAPAESVIQYSQHFEGNGASFFGAVDRLGLEGIVSKLASARYVSGPSRSWQKVKCFDETDYEIAAIQRERGKPAIAMMVDAHRNYVGSAFITLNKGMRERLWARVQDRPAKAPKGMKPKADVQWVKPGMMGRVRHLKGEEKLRHATLKDVREAD